MLLTVCVGVDVSDAMPTANVPNPTITQTNTHMHRAISEIILLFHFDIDGHAVARRSSKTNRVTTNPNTSLLDSQSDDDESHTPNGSSGESEMK
jgi:hypothetical protein